ncbi:phosphatidyl-N-methylethanolamine N-methyltransferase [Orenia metallireducens]|jgi:ubiquinone/menaquinone biosynthesis C-methylase UbiE|uniref:Phosphatidyl-N-methylethanolamine N-methyltransferase n=1 Tax=Orenia metallireducens TaxID=1413210 RepID=A0A285IDU9_9FIRM|nr:class I SAM-dependent methyltransferase [Orenia metallireducens]PRX19247.1 phosphatidyl-N-methylethanolamine N-methyltransferase [Orenia metallireducens]SNY46149.1 phosphatidyl-N-methylethanolamine N-methyltransferase [Orenia metallireducens]
MTKRTEKIKYRYNRIAPIYDRLESIMEKGRMGDWRQKLWQQVKELAKGKENVKLLEAGVGTGKNMSYYPERIEAYGIDFSERMLVEAKKRTEKLKVQVELREMDIQKLDFSDDYFDIIVTSCVFCSVPDPVQGLKELKRVCKDDGRIIMLEHMRSEKEPLGYFMDSINWVSLLTWGANINRKTMENIKKAGLEVIKEEDLLLDVVKELILSP